MLLALSFVMVAIASHSISSAFHSMGLPLVSGYLFAGIVAGPDLLHLIPERGIRSLRFVDEVSLAFLALHAGAQVRTSMLRHQMNGRGWITFFLVVCKIAGVGAAVLAMAPHIDFMKGMDTWWQVRLMIWAKGLACDRTALF